MSRQQKIAAALWFLGVTILILILVGRASTSPTQQENEIDRQFAWAQYTYDYSEHKWCVDAQRREPPGRQVGGCWPTRREADEGILHK